MQKTELRVREKQMRKVAKQKRPASRPGVADNWRLTTDD
jgi:hypothetical protein